MNRSKILCRALFGAISTVALTAAIMVPAHAQDTLVIVEPMHTSTYLNGGIGSEEEQYMRSIAKDWPLRITFAQSPGGEFVAGVRLLVTGSKGTPLLQLNDAGPMTYVRLPAGKYRIVASYKGKSETRDVTLDGKAGRNVSFEWKSAPAPAN